MRRTCLTLITAALVTASICGAQARPADLVITNASIIDMITGRVTPRQSIVIRGDTVVAIRSVSSGAAVPAARTVDAGGRFVIPALWDMHVHFGGGPALIAENRALLPLYTAHGIVAVRDAAGDLSPSVFAWRDSIALGLIDGPTLFTSGPKLEGINSVWPGDIEIDTRAGVDSALTYLQSRGVDFVKLTDNTLKPDLFRYALGEIRRRGLRSSAHIPASVTVREAVTLGLGSIEHLSYAVRAGAERDDKPASGDLLTAFDSATAMSAYRLMAAKGTYITPTLNISRVLAWLDTDTHAGDPYLRYIGPGLQATYQGRVTRAAQADAAAIARRHRMYEFTSARLPMLQAAGVQILAGTDAGFLNSFDYPGVGLHDELRLLVEAGLTPLQALRGATINGARFLGKSARHGTIARGKAADLLLLDRNPLLDITATRSIHALVQRGRYRDRPELDALLDSTAALVARMPKPAP
jgi:imidazolonepropionase-like amidohydrolase